MKRTYVHVASVMASAAMLVSFFGTANAQATPSATAAATASALTTTIKIGGAFALTGDESSLDLPAANGAKLAAKEINAAGGVLGQKIELIVHDSKYQMDVTAQIAKQFVEEDKVIGVVGFTDSDSALAAGPIIQKAGLPFITAGATSPKLPDQIGDMFYLACFGDNVQAAAGAEYSYKNFGKTAYLLIDKGVEYTTLLGAYFKARYTELGGTLAFEDTYEDNATDFSAQITKLKALDKQPDFYYIAAMPYNIGTIVKQLRDAGLTNPVVGGDGYDTPDLIKVAGAAAENVYFSTHALMDADNGTAGIKKFIAAYNKEYGHDPENAFAALGYDSLYLMVDAISRAKSTDPKAIQTALNATKNFVAITGSITFNGSRVPQKGVTLIHITGGKFTLGAEVVPEKVPSPDTK
jgi:branched-chain amino acid transport system substrate-binding protein